MGQEGDHVLMKNRIVLYVELLGFLVIHAVTISQVLYI